MLYRRTENDVFGRGLFDISETLYSQEKILRYIRNSTVQFVNTFVKPKDNSEVDPVDVIDKSGFVFMVAIYQRIMKFAKDGSFVDEDEVRLYHEAESVKETLKLTKSIGEDLRETVDVDFEKLFLDLVSALQIKDEHFMMSRAGIRSYRNLCLKEIWGSGLIPEIILGPMCVQNRKELDRFLRSNGLKDTKVSVSKVPIR